MKDLDEVFVFFIKFMDKSFILKIKSNFDGSYIAQNNNAKVFIPLVTKM